MKMFDSSEAVFEWPDDPSVGEDHSVGAFLRRRGRRVLSSEFGDVSSFGLQHLLHGHRFRLSSDELLGELQFLIVVPSAADKDGRAGHHEA